MNIIDTYNIKNNESLEERVDNTPKPSVEPDKKPLLTGKIYHMGKSLLGLCVFYGTLVPIVIGSSIFYKTPIVVNEMLGGDNRTETIVHERHHEEHPEDSELETRIKTQTEYFKPQLGVNYQI